MSKKSKVVLIILICLLAIGNGVSVYFNYTLNNQIKELSELYDKKVGEYENAKGTIQKFNDDIYQKNNEINRLNRRVNHLNDLLNQNDYNSYAPHKKHYSGNNYSGLYRIGAICNDGWQSSATGSGACSWHGGVKYWLYSDGTKRRY